MRKQLGVGLRTWVLGAAAAGLFSQQVPAAEQNAPVVTSGTKKPKSKPDPVQNTQPPKLLAVPDSTNLPANSIVPASQMEVAENDKTEVQRQLELLFEKNGREMPADMQLKMTPLNPPGKTPAAAAPQATPQAVPQAPPKGAPTTGARPVQPVPPPSAQKTAKPTPGYTRFQPVAPARPQTTNYPSPVPAQTAKNYAAAFDAQVPQQTQLPQQIQQPQQIPPQTQPQPRQNPVAGFFKKLIPGAHKPASTQPPIPPDYVNSVPEVPPASLATNPANQYALSQSKVPLTQVSKPVQSTSKPVLLPVTLNAEPIPLAPAAPKNPIAVGFSSSSNELPMPDIGLPALAQTPLPLPSNPSEAFMPPFKTESQPLPVAMNSKPEELVFEQPKLELANDFPNPFPDVPESQADLKGKALPNVGQVPVLQAPKVQVPIAQVPTVQVPIAEVLTPKEPETSVAALEPPKVDAPPKVEEDPYAVRVKDFAEPTIDEKVEANTPSVALMPTSPDVIAPPGPLTSPSAEDAKPAVGPALDVGALSQQPADALEPADPSDSYLEKMQRIRDRFGMKGLKGFCPVTLRDQRELLDAKPEFHFTHRSQKFHFASAEARDRFEAEPSLYAPAAYGADVVALGRDKDVVEGTLDFAAWYKGRLYLFGTQANYDVFVKSPVTYASPAGIE